MSKIVKGIIGGVKNLAKNIFSGVKRVFKSITGSTLGRALLIGATIYLGGAALGYWNSPFTSINGALAGTQSAAAAAEGAAGATGSSGAAETFGIGDAVAAPSAQALPAAADAIPAAVPTAPGVAAETASAIPGTVASPGGGLSLNLATAPAAQSPGMIARAANWFKGLKELPQYALIQTGAGALQSAFTPNATEQAEEMARIQRQQEQWRQAFLAPNFDVGSIDVGSPSGKPLTDTSGHRVVPPGFTVDPNGNVVPLKVAQAGMIGRAAALSG